MKPKPGHELAVWQLKRLPTAALSSPQPSGSDATPQAPAHSGARLVPPPVWRGLPRSPPSLSRTSLHSSLSQFLLCSSWYLALYAFIHLYISSFAPVPLNTACSAAVACLGDTFTAQVAKTLSSWGFHPSLGNKYTRKSPGEGPRVV